MDLFAFSEFADEYQDWLEGSSSPRRAAWLDVQVSQLELGPVLAVEPDTPVRDAIGLMNDHHRGAVLVVARQRLCGIFTERDVVRRVFARGVDLARTPLHEVMTRDPDTLEPSATLAQALRTMVRARYRHLPVVDGEGRPLAVASMHRIVQFVCEAFPCEIWNAPPERPSGVLALDGA
ncbi:MAG TPA: CBS domain-containing protein [Polyangiales bacterium]